MSELILYYTDTKESRRCTMHFCSIVEFIGMYSRGDLFSLESQMTDILVTLYGTYVKKYATLETLHRDLIVGTFIREEKTLCS